MIQLYPIQHRAVAKLTTALKTTNAVLNCSSTGTGKTLMGLAVAKELGLAPLIVAPLAAHRTWETWSSDMGIPILGVINVEKLRTGKTEWVTTTGKGKKASYRWNLDRHENMVLFDEIHRGLSGVTTQAGTMSVMLRPQGIKTLLMSATPFNSPLNMRNIGYLLRLHDYSLTSFYNFCRRHGCKASPFHRGLDFNPESRAAKEHLRRINEFIQPKLVRLTVEDMAEYFSDNIVEPTLVSLSNRDSKEIEAIYAEMEDEVRKKKHLNPLIDQLRARQRAELLSAPLIAEMIIDSLGEGYSVYVALSFQDSVDAVHSALAKAGVHDVAVYTGRTPKGHRPELVENFQRDILRVFLATGEAGGLSLSLHQVRPEQRPRTAIIRPTYKADVVLQCLGRIHRAGGLTPVVQRIVLCAKTVEEKVYRRMQAKITNISTLVDADLL